mmetsp:Transcript_34492/g.69702  ORF Transcript_34492/g.69702 Transcript_34492/m.69702 type:complete len:101 (-) Transcript_34492:579-881(-)
MYVVSIASSAQATPRVKLFGLDLPSAEGAPLKDEKSHVTVMLSTDQGPQAFNPQTNVIELVRPLPNSRLPTYVNSPVARSTVASDAGEETAAYITPLLRS